MKWNFAPLNKPLPIHLSFLFLTGLSTGEKTNSALDKLRQSFRLVRADSIHLAILHIELDRLGAGDIIKPATWYLSYPPSIIPGALFDAEIFDVFEIELLPDQSDPEFYFQIIHISGDSQM